MWATLRAYGRSGYRAIVEKHLDLAQHLARRVDEEPDLERLADVSLNIVCFRYHPPGYAEDRLDDLNRRIGEEAILDGRVFFGMTEYDGKRRVPAGGGQLAEPARGHGSDRGRRA